MDSDVSCGFIGHIQPRKSRFCCRLATSKITYFDVNKNPHGSANFLRQKQRVRKLWRETLDPTCRTGLSCATKTSRNTPRRMAL